MNTSRQIFAAVVLVALGAGAASLVPRGGSGSPSPRALQEDGSARVHDLDPTKAESLEAAVRRLERTVGHVAAESARARTGAPAAAEGARPPTIEEARANEQSIVAREAVQAEARFQQLDAFHRGGSPDPTWSTAVDGQLRRHLSDEAYAGISLSALDCRSTTCRVELAVGGSDEERTRVMGMLAPAVSLVPGFGGAMVRLLPVEAGQVGQRAVAYLAKDGTRFPDEP